MSDITEIAKDVSEVAQKGFEKPNIFLSTLVVLIFAFLLFMNGFQSSKDLNKMADILQDIRDSNIRQNEILNKISDSEIKQNENLKELMLILTRK